MPLSTSFACFAVVPFLHLESMCPAVSRGIPRMFVSCRSTFLCIGICSRLSSEQFHHQLSILGLQLVDCVLLLFNCFDKFHNCVVFLNSCVCKIVEGSHQLSRQFSFDGGIGSETVPGESLDGSVLVESSSPVNGCRRRGVVTDPCLRRRSPCFCQFPIDQFDSTSLG